MKEDFPVCSTVWDHETRGGVSVGPASRAQGASNGWKADRVAGGTEAAPRQKKTLDRMGRAREIVPVWRKRKHTGY